VTVLFNLMFLDTGLRRYDKFDIRLPPGIRRAGTT